MHLIPKCFSSTQTVCGLNHYSALVQAKVRQVLTAQTHGVNHNIVKRQRFEPAEYAVAELYHHKWDFTLKAVMRSTFRATQ